MERVRSRYRVGILASHPVQYQAPWFRALAQVVELEVFFAHRQSAQEQGRAGFGVAFDWDVDLLSGYRHRFLKNVALRPGVDQYAGCDTPEMARIIEAGMEIGEPGKGAPRAAEDPVGGRELPSQARFDAFIVMGWYLKSYLQAAQACRRAGVPVLVRGDSQLRTPRPVLKRLAMELRQRLLLRRFDGFLSVGVCNREYLEHFGVKPERIFFVPHFVDNAWFRAKAGEANDRKAELRRSWGVQEADLVALFVGKFIPEKRPLDLLKAVARTVTSAAPQGARKGTGGGSGAARWVAVFVGAGALERPLREFADRARVRAHFAGFKNQSELPACYAAADALVLPSESETWGLVVNEAMVCGIPAVVSEAVGCAPDLVEEGCTGFSFPVGDVDALAERLTRLAQMRASGHDFAPALRSKMERFSVQTAVEGTLQAIERLVDLSWRGSHQERLIAE